MMNWPNRFWIRNIENNLWHSREVTDEDKLSRKDCEIRLQLARQRRIDRGYVIPRGT